MRVIETRKRVLGEEHPDTLISMNNLAYTLKSLGGKDDALGLITECHQRRERILGSTHPDFLATDETLRAWSLG